MNRPTFHYEETWRQRGCQYIAGVDEAGRGPLAGPVSVAAVMLPVDFSHAELNDSKQLDERTRETIYEELLNTPEVIWSVNLVEVEEIDRINILQATRVGMRRAALALARSPQVVLIDGLKVPDFPFEQQAIVKGDALSLSIAAASLVAKVTRDRYMRDACSRYPHYGFAKHKGYGTRQHLAALHQHGPCPLHRRSFAPVRALLCAAGQA